MPAFEQKPKTTRHTTPAKSTVPDRAQFGQSSEDDLLLQLQRLIGNRTVQQVLKVNAGDGKRETATEITRSGHDINRIARYCRSNLKTFPPGNTDQQTVYRIPFTQHISRALGDEEEIEGGQIEPGGSIFIGEITTPEEIIDSSLDSITSTVKNVPSVSQGGVAPSGFGITRTSAQLSNVHITHSATTFTMTTDLVLTITWQVRTGTGPNSQVDIASETDSDIKAGNYTNVVSDLTPDMSDLKGRPPRNNFWAQDLTEQHELFHTKQRSGKFGDDTATAIKNWLNGRTATSADDIKNTLLPQALSEGIRVFNAFVSAPSTEEDAYSDGAPSYTARSKAIKKKGDAGEYK